MERHDQQYSITSRLALLARLFNYLVVQTSTVDPEVL